VCNDNLAILKRQFGQRLGGGASSFMLISPTLEPPLGGGRFVTLATSIAA
jgi:hypothetical protein